MWHNDFGSQILFDRFISIVLFEEFAKEPIKREPMKIKMKRQPIKKEPMKKSHV